MPVATPMFGDVLEHVPARLQRGAVLRAERRLGVRRGAVALRGARRRERIGQAHAEVDLVDEDLQHRRDDRRAARRAECEHRPAVVEDQRRGHARARALARGRRVRRAGGEVEVGQLVVEQEAAARHGDATAADLLDRERVGDDVAPAVGDGQVRRRGALVVRARLAVAAVAAAVVGPRVARGRHCGRRGRVDQRAPLVGEAVGEQAAQRDGRLDEGGIAHVLPAVRVGELGRLEVLVQLVGARLGAREALHDVERLADRGAAGGRRRHAVDVEPAVADLGRVAADRVVALEVAGRHRARVDRVRAIGVGRHRRMLDRLRDVAGDAALVEVVRVLADALVRLRHVRVALDVADRLGGLRGRQVELAARREVVEQVGVVRDLLVERRVDAEALATDLLGGPQQRRQPLRAVAIERRLPPAHGAGDADAEAAGARLGELRGVGRVPLREGVLLHARPAPSHASRRCRPGGAWRRR